MRAARLVSAVAGLAACGRIDFATRAPADAAIDAPPDAIDAIDAPAGPLANVAWVQSFVGIYGNGGTTTLSGSARANAAGDAIAILIACGGVPSPPTTFSLSAPGWSFAQSAFFGSSTIWGVALSGIAPDTNPVTLAIEWSPACVNGITMIGDEFTNNDPAGGAITFDGHVETYGSGACSGTVTAADADAAVWAGCASSDPITGPGSGFTQGTTDGAGDFTEYELTSAPASTPEPVTFVNDASHNFVLAALTIKPL